MMVKVYLHELARLFMITKESSPFLDKLSMIPKASLLGLGTLFMMVKESLCTMANLFTIARGVLFVATIGEEHLKFGDTTSEP
jgi:hypothetical protein